MKKTMLFLLALVCFIACTQKNNSKEPGVEKFNSKYVRLLEDTLKMMMIEKVVISYGDLYAEADSALLEKPVQTVTMYGIRKAVFKGKELTQEERKGIIRYKKGGELVTMN
jgi:hypothetical protein